MCRSASYATDPSNSSSGYGRGFAARHPVQEVAGCTIQLTIQRAVQATADLLSGIPPYEAEGPSLTP